MNKFPEYLLENQKMLDDNKLVVYNDFGVKETDYEGHHCGYVSFPKKIVPELFRDSYDHKELYGLDIHGGLTFHDRFDNGPFEFIIFGF